MKNITYERYIFNIKNQNQEENIEEFETDLRRIKKNCAYCNICGDGILRDKIILGIKNKDLITELLKIKDIKLESCIDICRESETAITQTDKMGGYKSNNKITKHNTYLKHYYNNDSNNNNFKNYSKNNNYKHRNNYDNNKVGRNPGQNFNKCKYCGIQHEFNKYICPAFDKICNICQKKDHFNICCRLRNSIINYMQE